ncbi:MAG TPA: GH116 family glycosyl hydrolase [Gemmatimonadales bacterium]|nr:GH116 family glycosyl hydrolase [Gemmatimonadales bacterium]
MSNPSLPRRDFLRHSATALGALGAAGIGSVPRAGAVPAELAIAGARLPPRTFDGSYTGARLSRVAFPMGGLGAGMLCLDGSGSLSHVSVRNHPDVYNEPCIFAGVAVRGDPPTARVVEGPVPGWKIFGLRGSANGDAGSSYGLPRFGEASCKVRFPFSTVTLTDDAVPLDASVTGWSPFTPPDTDMSSLPVAALEYRFRNTSGAPVDAVFSFNATNFLPLGGTDRRAVRGAPGGFILRSAGADDEPWKEAAFCATVDDAGARVNLAWFRGGWWDPLTMAWRDVATAACYDRPAITDGEPSPGATIFVPFHLAAGASKTITVRLAWYAAKTDLRRGHDIAGAPKGATYEPWYAGRFADVADVASFWRAHYDELRARTAAFSECFHDSTLPPEVIEAASANLAILKSPTILRQRDGRMWAWEGCSDDVGCCFGSCTHVWNYAQAIAHLFPSLERTLRETEFGPSQDTRGHQAFRTALPIRPQVHDYYAAADGQLGGIMKVHREWRISGDTDWLRGLWRKVRVSLDYCIETWDPDHLGWLVEPHHNTYDIEFWGPDGMCTSFYLGALRAAIEMGSALGDDVSRYAALLDAGRRRAESELFDGEYFCQRVEWKNLRASRTLDLDQYSPEARALFEREGPKYQYGTGCLSDGVLGAWMARVCGVGPVLDAAKVASHVLAVHRHNFKPDLSAHANPQRPSYAYGSEGGLLLCSWPKGGALSLPFVYSDEVWTGIEYQVASHLMMTGHVREGLEIVRACRARYDGHVRNPFDEYECGHWYARALSSYALLEGLSGARYDAVDGTLHLAPSVRGDFRSFLATATGFGTVGVRNGKPFLDVRAGTIDVRHIDYRAPA